MSWLTLDRGLALAGLLIGLPGVLSLFLSANENLAIFAGILGVILLGTAYVVRLVLNAAPYGIKKATVTLSFPNGVQTAVMCKQYKIVPNFRHLTQMEHKNIAADGTIRNICWDDKPVPSGRIQQRLGEWEIKIDLPFQPRRWQEFQGKLSYECIDSFNGNPEALMYCVDFPTKQASIIVEFPNGRPCLSAEARKIQGSGENPIQNPIISADRQKLQLDLRRPTYGAQYIVYWTW